MATKALFGPTQTYLGVQVIEKVRVLYDSRVIPKMPWRLK